MKYLSPTKLKKFRACPYQMAHEPFKKSPATEFGSAVHAALAALYASGVDPLETFRRESATRGLPMDTIDRAAEVFGNLDHPKLAISSDTIITVESADGEYSFKTPAGVRTLAQASIVDGVWGISGSMDLVDVRPGNHLRILDWKIGHSEEDDDLQLAVYALLGWKKYQFPVIETAFFYLEKGVYQSSMWTGESLVAALEYVEALAHRVIEADRSGVYPQTPHKNCKWCSLKDGCTAFAKQLAGAPDRASWDLDASPENLPKILEHIDKLDAVAKAAYGICESLKEKRNEALRAAGGVATIDGRTYKMTERVSSYDYDLGRIFTGLQDILGRPPVEVCKFDSGGFDDLVKGLDKEAKKSAKAIKDANKTVKGRSVVVTCSISKDPAPTADEASEDAGVTA